MGKLRKTTKILSHDSR